VCTHIADIDYETIILYTGGYDDMVLSQKTARSAPAWRSQNAQREKKIAQLNEFIARFSAGTRSSQVTSRKKEVERLANHRAGALQYPASVHSLRSGCALRQAHPRVQAPD
jgi:ATPase subunit of ABC transporter with duplicated ATPase domains